MAILGLVLTIGAFVGFIYFSVVISPPPYRYLVYRRDMVAGDKISADDIAVVEVIGLQEGLKRLYVPPERLEQVIGARLLENVRSGQPVNPSALTGSLNRSTYSAVLTTPHEVVVSIPIRQGIAPKKLAVGDLVNFSAIIEGPEFDIANTPTPTPFGAPFGLSAGQFAATPSETNEAGETGEESEAAEAQPTPTPTPRVLFPIVDVILENVPIIDIERDLIENPNRGQGEQFIPGDIKAITVKVPKRYDQILLMFAAKNQLRISVASPFSARNQNFPQPPLTYDEYGRLVRYKIEESVKRADYITLTVLGEYINSFYPEVAQSILATREAFLTAPNLAPEKVAPFRGEVLRQTPTPE